MLQILPSIAPCSHGSLLEHFLLVHASILEESSETRAAFMNVLYLALNCYRSEIVHNHQKMPIIGPPNKNNGWHQLIAVSRGSAAQLRSRERARAASRWVECWISTGCPRLQKKML